MEGIQGGTGTDSVPATETVRFIQGTYCSTSAHGTRSNKYIIVSDFGFPCSVWEHFWSHQKMIRLVHCIEITGLVCPVKS